MQNKISSFVLKYFWEYYTYDIISNVLCASWKFSSCGICIRYYTRLFVLACSWSVKCEVVCISQGTGMISNFQIWDICNSFPVWAIGPWDNKLKISLKFQWQCEIEEIRTIPVAHYLIFKFTNIGRNRNELYSYWWILLLRYTPYIL